MNKILLVGAGPMAIDYAKILKALDIDVIVVGRGETSAERFEAASGIPVYTGGIESWLMQNKDVPCKAFVAVSEMALGKVTLLLLERGIKSLLVEKPGAANAAEVEQVLRKAIEKGSRVYVAYNRRFYSSVQKAKEIIKEDGGVTSFNFEFTEWSHVIKDLPKEEGVKKQWFLHNSTHVMDLAFYLGGRPKEISCYTAGGLNWHPSGSIYSGAGITENGALFSYQANWESPGRWGVEVLTKKHRLILRPLERLHIQNIGNVAVEEVSLEDELDKKFKPGLYLQVQAFVEGKTTNLPDIQEQSINLHYYQMIGGKKQEAC